MKVTNNTSYPVIAFGSETMTGLGYGDDVTIQPGDTVEVSGPYIGEMDGGDCYIHLAGEITCHEGPDDDNGYQVIQGNPLCLSASRRGVTVRHHLDPLEQHVAEWRLYHRGQKK